MTATAETATDDNGPKISPGRPHGGLWQPQTMIFSRPAYGESNDHVTDNVKWPQKVKRLEPNISRIAGDAV